MQGGNQEPRAPVRGSWSRAETMGLECLEEEANARIGRQLWSRNQQHLAGLGEVVMEEVEMGYVEMKAAFWGWG